MVGTNQILKGQAFPDLIRFLHATMWLLTFCRGANTKVQVLINFAFGILHRTIAVQWFSRHVVPLDKYWRTFMIFWQG